MVTVLRDEDRSESESRRQPRLADLPRLVLDSGTGAQLSPTRCSRGVAGAIERAAYRTVQEALTNVRKHATGAQVTVSWCPIHGAIRVRIPTELAPDVRASTPGGAVTRGARTHGVPAGGPGRVALVTAVGRIRVAGACHPARPVRGGRQS